MIELILVPLVISILTNIAKRFRVSSEVVGAVLSLFVSLAYGLAMKWYGGQSIGNFGEFVGDVFLKANGLYALYLGWKNKRSLKEYVTKQRPASSLRVL